MQPHVTYVSERITNIGELECLLHASYSEIESLRHELEKENPATDRIDELSKQLHLHLLQAKDFEFCVERRKTIASD